MQGQAYGRREGRLREMPCRLAEDSLVVAAYIRPTGVEEGL